MRLHNIFCKKIYIKVFSEVILILFFCLILFLIISADPAFAREEDGWQVNQWAEMPGPAGGKVTSVEIDPYNCERMFATTPWGLFKSSDQGDKWYEFGFLQQSLNEIKFHPVREGLVFLGTDDGLYVSHDHGYDWEFVREKPGIEKVYSLDFSSLDRDMVLVGTESGVYISNDGGESFDLKEKTNSPVNEVQIYGPNPNQLYAVVKEEGLLISNDRGDSWRNIGEELPGNVLTVDINPHDNNLVFVGTTYGIYRTAEGGKYSPEWSASGVVGSYVYSLKLDEQRPYFLLAGSHEEGLLNSNDSGETWTSREDIKDFEVLDILYHPVDGGQIFLATADNGVIKMDINLSGYEYLNEGISSYIEDIKASNEHRDLLLAVTDSGLFKSEDGGNSWERILEEEAPMEIFLENYNISEKIRGEDNYEDIPSRGELLHVIKNDKVLYSFDWGETWHEISTKELNRNIFQINVNPINPKEMWVGTERGIYVTEDDGNSWELVGLEEEFISMLELVYCENEEKLVVYSGSYNILYKSDDSGGNFETINEMEDISPSQMVVNPENYEELWLGTYGQGVYYSNNSGRELEERNRGLPVGESGYNTYYPAIHTLKQKPGYPGNLFVALEEGVYFSNSKGEYWEKTEGIDIPVKNLAVHYDPPTQLYVGTEQGVFRYESYEIPYMGWEEEDYYTLKEPIVLNLKEEFNLKNVTGQKLEDLIFKTPSVVEHGTYQFVYERKLQPEPAAIEGSEKTLPGNEKLLFEKDMLEPDENWEIKAENTLVNFGIEFDFDEITPEPYDEESELYETYTSQTLMSDPTDQEIQEKAKEIVEDEDDPVEKAKLIFNWVHDYIEYVPPGNVGASKALEKGEGVCADYSDLFVALARAEGIPSRRLSGYYITGEEEGQFHAWAEFYLEGYGWVPVEPTFAGEEPRDNFGKLNSTHVFMSWDVVRQEYTEFLEFQETFSIEEVDKKEKDWKKEVPFEFDVHLVEEDLKPPREKLVSDKKLVYLVIGKNQYYVDEVLKELDVEPYISNARTMVPVRFIAESIGASVDYFEKDHEVEINYEEEKLIISLEEMIAKLNGEELEMDENPEIKHGRTMVPLRFINETLGAEVEYETSTQEIFIYH